MTTYAVYEHRVLGRKAVKRGFSVGGFFFPVIWALIQKLWWLAAVLFIWASIATAMDAILSNTGGHGPGGALFAQFLFYHLPAGLIVGFAGNGLVRSSLERQGYTRVRDLEARSPEDALSQAAPIARSVPSPTRAAEGADLSAQLARLNELRQKGALSEAEYQTAKAKILS